MTLSIILYIKTTLSALTLTIFVFWRNDAQHKNIQSKETHQNDTKPNNTQLSDTQHTDTQHNRAPSPTRWRYQSHV